MKFSVDYTVDTHNTDISGVVRPSCMLRYIQQATSLQMRENPPSNDDLRREGKAFLLSRMRMSLYRPVREFEKITAQTWVPESRGYAFNRCGRILRGNTVVAESVMIWALVDIKTRKLLRVADNPLPFEPEEPLSLDVADRIKIPDWLNLSLVGERTVAYSDTDINGHMNNTNYPDVFCDYIPDMKGKRVLSMVVSYINEAVLGETFKVYYGEGNGTLYFKTILPGGKIGAEAEFTVDDITE